MTISPFEFIENSLSARANMSFRSSSLASDWSLIVFILAFSFRPVETFALTVELSWYFDGLSYFGT